MVKSVVMRNPWSRKVMKGGMGLFGAIFFPRKRHFTYNPVIWPETAQQLPVLAFFKMDLVKDIGLKCILLKKRTCQRFSFCLSPARSTPQKCYSLA